MLGQNGQDVLKLSEMEYSAPDQSVQQIDHP